MTARLVVVNLQSERKRHKPLPVYRLSNKQCLQGGKVANVKRKLEEMAQISEEVDVFNLHSLINTRGVVWVQKKIDELNKQLKEGNDD